MDVICRLFYNLLACRRCLCDLFFIYHCCIFLHSTSYFAKCSFFCCSSSPSSFYFNSHRSTRSLLYEIATDYILLLLLNLLSRFLFLYIFFVQQKIASCFIVGLTATIIIDATSIIFYCRHLEVAFLFGSLKEMYWLC